MLVECYLCYAYFVGDEYIQPLIADILRAFIGMLNLR